MSAGLTCTRAIAAAARAANPRRRPPGPIPPRLVLDLSREREMPERKWMEGGEGGARHRMAWVRCGLFWSEPRGRAYITPGRVGMWDGRMPSTSKRVRGDATSRSHAGKDSRRKGGFPGRFYLIFCVCFRSPAHPPLITVVIRARAENVVGPACRRQ